MASPFANILHRDAMKQLVDARTFQRGERYLADRRVSDLVRRASALSAVVRGTTSYRVRLWVKDASLGYSCSCPMGEEGHFCKHGVAVGLAWVARQPPR